MPITSTVRSPRGLVRLNGEIIPGWTAVEVENNAYSSADTFSCTFVASMLPPDRSADWFSNQKDGYVEILIGNPPDAYDWKPADLSSWIYGQIDKIDYDPVAGTIEVSGRDLTRVFIDSKITEKFQNKTSSQIATILAQRHGMDAIVTATKTQVGKYYEIDHEHMHAARTEWDLLVELARAEQYVVYVRGKTLFFQPRSSVDDLTKYPVTWSRNDDGTSYPSCNVVGLKLGRALTVSRGVVVTVRSWNDAAKKVFTASYPTSKAKSITPGMATLPKDAQSYVYNVANLTQEKVVQLAQAKYKEIIAHEMTASFELPGDDALDVANVISLTGTGTAWDQLYYPESIRRTLSFDSGYRMEVHAKNHAPDSEVS